MTEKSKNKIKFTVGKRYRTSTKLHVDLLGLVCVVLE